MHPAFNLEKSTLLLEIASFPIPEKIQSYAIEHGMTPKAEIHCTVLGFGAGKKILEIMQQQKLSAVQQAFVLNHLAELAKSISWSYQPGSEYFFLEKVYPNGTKRESIIGLVVLSGQHAFLAKIQELFGIAISLFPHVTLYAKTSNPEEIPLMGIGIQDLSEFLNTKKTRI